eukprot:CAMPEP_0197718452 /NCGR_PEP_ID=MMETSP1434-20131217/2602_1 /TAXON_ID=265543 /ORGANISM="Minutocellus polymorphus, Strain CCMP3303" /LENGTH=311 /DNA_ID=CAMNT_0043303107 /DNA_START=280 /DNA_END=1215 /DNA_ORIENTATION=+
MEDFIMKNATLFGMDSTGEDGLVPMCDMLKESSTDLNRYLRNLEKFNSLVDRFVPLQEDIRSMQLNSGKIACDQLLLSNSTDTAALFEPGLISFSSKVGAIEPLLPPLRHPQFCKDSSKVMNLDYMLHDFPVMCTNLEPSARTIFVDMGASLDFHGESDMPAMYILKLYRKFGFRFDHIYAWEVTPTKPSEVFQKVPPEFFAAYHWMNVGVESDKTSVLNPLEMLAENYNEDDFIVVKLDIDTPSVELPLVQQLLTDDKYVGLVDQFYFEHHVHLKELAPYWGAAANGSVSDSLRVFQSLRQKGIGAHSWV